MDKTDFYLKYAIELAERSRGKCSPNPFVGAVIVKDGKIIGEGSTQPSGCDHAEVQAIKQASESCNGADLYVTLEPCAHYGKTPPCAEAIIRSGIKRVFAGIIDPNPKVNGKGFEMLRQAGIEIHYGFFETEITKQLEYYLTYITQQRPFFFMKTATTLDGRIAASDGSSRWITGELSRIRVHQLRQEADVVLTGIGTILKDNPLLNVRLDDIYKQPLRSILDPELELPPDSQIVKTAVEFSTLVFCRKDLVNSARAKELKALHLDIWGVEHQDNLLSLQEVASELYNREYYAVMIEAGNRLNSSFLQSHLVDKLYTFIAPKLLGGNNMVWQDIGVESINQAVRLTDIHLEKTGDDILISGYPSYFNREVSNTVIE